MEKKPKVQKQKKTSGAAAAAQQVGGRITEYRLVMKEIEGKKDMPASRKTAMTTSCAEILKELRQLELKVVAEDSEEAIAKLLSLPENEAITTNATVELLWTRARLKEKPIAEIAEDLRISDSCLRGWMKQADKDEGRVAEGLSTAERDELAKLRKELRVAKLENEILKRAAAYFAAENVLPK